MQSLNKLIGEFFGSYIFDIFKRKFFLDMIFYSQHKMSFSHTRRAGQDDQLRRTLEASHGIAVRDDLAQAVLDAEASQAGQKA